MNAGLLILDAGDVLAAGRHLVESARRAEGVASADLLRAIRLAEAGIGQAQQAVAVLGRRHDARVEDVVRTEGGGTDGTGS